MATPMREGLRVRLPKPSVQKPTQKTNAQRCKDYREMVQDDPLRLADYRLKYQERNRKNRHKILTDEEKQRQREQNRLRQQRFRDKHKAVIQPRTLGATQIVTTRRQQKQEQAAIDARREKWRKYKHNERQTWSSQKKRRNRERALAWYHTNKKPAVNTQSESTPTQEAPTGNTVTTPVCVSEAPSPQQTVSPRPDREAAASKYKTSTSGERKALNRAKITIAKLKPNVFSKLLTFLLKKSGVSTGISSSADVVSGNVLGELQKLKSKRSKASLAAKRSLQDAVDGQTPRGNRTDIYVHKNLSPAVSTLQEFLDDVSISLPGKKTVDRRTFTQKKILPKAVRQLEKEFSQKHPNHKVSRATFYRHIPKHILTSTHFKHQSCLCEICVSIDNKLNVFNKHLNVPFEGRDSLSELTLCSHVTVTLDCLQRTCIECGVAQVKELIYNQLNKESFNVTVKWLNWEISKDPMKKHLNKGPEPIEKETSLEEMISCLLLDLKSFSMHLFVFRWQYTQFKLCKATIPGRKSLGLAVLDFSENFACRPQDEVQSAYYGYTQITVHPCVLYYACPQSECSEIVTEYIIFLSDDLKHDASMAQTILNKTVQHMQFRMANLKHLAVYSDGCAAQYKSKLPFHYLSDMATQIQIDRAYFGSRHGKGPCDACGGVIKKAVEHDILSRQVSIKDAETMFEHCKNIHTIPLHEPHAETCCHTRRMFFLIKEDDINRSFKSSELVTVPGTRKMHSLRRVRRDVIQTRNLSCFCTACLDYDETVCANTQYVKPWETFKIKHVLPNDSSDESSDEDAEQACLSFEENDNDAVYDDDSDDDAVYDSVCNVTLTPEENILTGSATNISTIWNSDLMNNAFIEEPHGSLRESFKSPLPREYFFAALQKKCSACKSYTELCKVVSDVSESLTLYPIPPIHPRCLYDVGSLDSASLSYVPKGLEHIFPVSTVADGNCVPRSFSLIVFGDQDHHIEIRCRIVHELVLNDFEYLALGEPELEFLCKLSDFYGTDVKKVFQSETLEVSKPSRLMGMWQIMAAANVFQASVLSIYPSSSKELDIYRHFYDRTVVPRNLSCSQILVILWTTTRKDNCSESLLANHVVPLMPLTTVSEIVIG